MKELSIEEKIYNGNYKAYTELINRLEDVKDAIKKQNYGIAMNILCKPYPEFQITASPELKEESEDERIRKRICKLLWDNVPYEEAQEYITWLEKQGNPTEDELEALRMAAYEPTKNWSEKLQSLYEKLTHCEQKSIIEMKTPEENLGIDSDTYNKIVDECIYGEQKPADVEEISFFEDFRKTDSEVEPKFKVGDNIEPIDSCLGSPRTIYKICDGWYETNQGNLNFEFENNWRLIEHKPAWSEEDDKILKSIIINIENLQFSEDMREKYHHIPNANKSYYQIKIDWLKSLKNRVLPQQKQEWNGEDESYYDAIIAKLEVTREDALLTDNEMDFLKSLEGRVFPKSTWNEEDDEHLERILKELGNQRQRPINSPYLDKIESDYNWLKSLRPQNRWKPSEEQMTQLKKYCPDNRPLTLLYEQLKKLVNEK